MRTISEQDIRASGMSLKRATGGALLFGFLHLIGCGALDGTAAVNVPAATTPPADSTETSAKSKTIHVKTDQAALTGQRDSWRW